MRKRVLRIMEKAGGVRGADFVSVCPECQQVIGRMFA
jgi:hypothetical protein